MNSGRRFRALSIAGSDSGGGAGIQADLKAFAACGVHGMTAVTAITAQNTVRVSAIQQLPPELIRAQVEAVTGDIGLDAVKIGMLGDELTITTVASVLEGLPERPPVVLDPVMVAESGAALLEPGARRALLCELLPRATVITPNLPEARALVAEAVLSGALPSAPAEVADMARALHGLGPSVVIITGGHREHASDVFCDGVRLEEIPGPRYPDGASHGSGCTHSAVLTARLARGDDPLQAARVAKRLASEAVRQGLAELGAGSGPVDVLAGCGAAFSTVGL